MALGPNLISGLTKLVPGATKSMMGALARAAGSAIDAEIAAIGGTRAAGMVVVPINYSSFINGIDFNEASGIMQVHIFDRHGVTRTYWYDGHSIDDFIAFAKALSAGVHYNAEVKLGSALKDMGSVNAYLKKAGRLARSTGRGASGKLSRLALATGLRKTTPIAPIVRPGRR